MKILYLAFACNPFAGSEAQCGWAWPITMRKYAEVSVVTRIENKENIEKYIRSNDIRDIKIYYHDIPSWLNIYKKTGKLYHLYYLIWQKTLDKMIVKLHKDNQYDYIHHITLGDFRSICRNRTSARFLFGPVGGGQLTPKEFSEYAKEDKLREWIRILVNKVVGHLPSYRKKINEAEMVFAANKETKEYLDKCLINDSKCYLLTENGIFKNKLEEKPKKNIHEKVYILWSGRMVNRKGLLFLLDVISEVQTKTPFELLLVGDGVQKNKIKKKIQELHLEEVVKLIGQVSYEEMQDYYKKCDIFVFPSLRETTGTVLFEAMSNGLPVITFNQNGADLLIDEKCGIKVDVKQKVSKIRKDFACSIAKLVDDPKERITLGNYAYEKILYEYTWDTKCEKFFQEYLL